MNRFILYKLLTTSEIDDGNNLLESLNYFENGITFVDILETLLDSKVKFTVKYGYHGSAFEKKNKFKMIILTIESSKDKLDKILDNYKDCILYSLKGNDLTIKLI